MRNKSCLVGVMMLCSACCFGQKAWTLRECIDYALEHNIQLKQNILQSESADEDVKQSRAQLLPSLSFQSGQTLNYRPFPEGGGYTVTNGYVDAKVKKVTYNGSYGINANWTIWNGNKNRNQVKQNELSARQAELNAMETANSIQEQITLLYVQILYNTEAVGVLRQVVEVSKQNLQRGKDMLTVGQIARADVAQLEAQLASDEYNLVNAQGQVAQQKLQLKQLLEITDSSDFDIVVPKTSEEQALAAIPSVADTSANALTTRPEVKNAQLGIEASEVQMKIARAGHIPTIGLNASIGASTNSSSDNSWGQQMKNNLNGGLGFNINVPIVDQRQTRTNIRKAKIDKESRQLELQNVQKELWSKIEGYWLDANTNQARLRSSMASASSAAESYNLVSEQFKEGLKNIQELTTGKTTLLNAEQSRLESKYTAIYSLQMLKFIAGNEIEI